MSFATMKKASKTSFKQLAEKMSNEGKQGSYDDNRFWTPDVDKSGSGYAVIRFLPTAEGGESPYIKLYSHGFKIGNRWMIENCPTSMGNGTPCPVCEANNILWNSGIEENKEIVRKRKRQLKYISNIIVLSDAKHPENEGKVFLFSYGTKIFSKLMNAINPEFEDETSFNPFDFWDGAPFKLKIRNVEGYRNYDKSEFADRSPLFDNDEALEKVWKSQYSLDEFLAVKNFKSYDELKTKFYATLNAPTAIATKEDGGDDNDDTPAPPPASRSAKPAADKPKTTASDDDDDFALFRTMIDD